MLRIKEIVRKVLGGEDYRLENGEWNTERLKERKEELIDILLELRDYFFIPYNVFSEDATKIEKMKARSIERGDLKNITVLQIIKLINTIQDKHSRSLGIDIEDLKDVEETQNGEEM